MALPKVAPSARDELSMGPGIETPQDGERHAARSSVRRLAAALFDAWDEGDTAGVTALFSPNGRWTDPSGATLSGPDVTMGTAYTAWREWEPWSIHLLSNEQIEVIDGERCRGTWLWFAASTTGRGLTAAWSGGDLSMEAARTRRGWVIESLAMTDRYRSDYARGWLSEPAMAVPHLHEGEGADEGAKAALGPLEGPGADPAGAPVAPEDLFAEIELRSLMGRYIDDLEKERSAAAVASHWTDGGVLVLEQPGGDAATGPDAIALLIERERSQLTAHTRTLFSESIEVSGAVASGSWRDLWTGVRNGEAVWVAHRYLFDAARGPYGWKFQKMTRRCLLDCRYRDGWLGSTGAKPGSPP